MRVLVIDDSAFMRRALVRMIESDPELKVIGTARNGKEGLDMAIAERPDVITLDIEMPEMDGLTALRMIRARCPEPRPQVLMCSSLTHAGSHEALKALRLGAADVIGKESSDHVSVDRMRDELISKIKALGRQAPLVHAAPPARRLDAPDFASVELIAIGSSTGGPPVLETILTALPADVSVPIVVAQHMPALFTRSLSERLDQVCQLAVRHAQEGRTPLEPRTIYLIQGGMHGRVARTVGRRFELIVGLEPTSALYRPSVDVLLTSVSEACGPKAIGMVLTGMGDDGKEGAIALHRAGGKVLAQSGPTCVVYGMPRAVVEAGVAHAAMAPRELGGWLSSIWTRTAAKAG